MRVSVLDERRSVIIKRFAVLAVAIAARMVAACSFRMALRARVAAIVAIVFFYRIFDIDNTYTVGARTFLLGHCNHYISPSVVPSCPPCSWTNR